MATSFMMFEQSVRLVTIQRTEFILHVLYNWLASTICTVRTPQYSIHTNVQVDPLLQYLLSVNYKVTT